MIIKSEKLFQILIKLLNPEILFCKPQTSMQIKELLLNPEIYFANPKKYFVRSYLRQQSAILHTGGAGVGKEFVIVYNMKYNVLP